MNKEIKLVIVSGRTIVVRSIEHVTNKEISGCTSMMKQTLLICEESVIFEHFQQEIPVGEERPPEVPTDIIKAAIKAKKEIRVLSEREILAIKKVHYRAI